VLAQIDEVVSCVAVFYFHQPVCIGLVVSILERLLQLSVLLFSLRRHVVRGG
jgi:hypothetical protein